ncbi:hypothetical protein HPG69_001306, partial [Diceros bicornis minor]
MLKCDFQSKLKQLMSKRQNAAIERLPSSLQLPLDWHCGHIYSYYRRPNTALKYRQLFEEILGQSAIAITNMFGEALRALADDDFFTVTGKLFACSE